MLIEYTCTLSAMKFNYVTKEVGNTFGSLISPWYRITPIATCIGAMQSKVSRHLLERSSGVLNPSSQHHWRSQVNSPWSRPFWKSWPWLQLWTSHPTLSISYPWQVLKEYHKDYLVAVVGEGIRQTRSPILYKLENCGSVTISLI